MKRLMQVMLMAGVGLMMTGCGNIHGSWKSVEVMPADSAAYFNLATAHFCCDGSYECEATINGQAENSKGTYKYEGTQLTLMPEGGAAERMYTAKVCCNQLTIEYAPEGKETITVKMEKQPCPENCGKCDGSCGEKCKGDGDKEKASSCNCTDKSKCTCAQKDSSDCKTPCATPCGEKKS
ncbi:MAG: hypothetical protein HJJLKODD_01187 [Phycisphaerae bacterium]|nr:hypothetical protein [Phycisphaerae bacterium]